MSDNEQEAPECSKREHPKPEDYIRVPCYSSSNRDTVGYWIREYSGSMKYNYYHYQMFETKQRFADLALNNALSLLSNELEALKIRVKQLEERQQSS